MAIDPSVFRGPDGTLFMAFGSHWTGIWIVELDPLTGHLAPEANRAWSRDNPAFHQVAKGPPTEEFPDGGAIEAAFVYRYGDYYYLFVNWGICCNGVNSTYNIRVGRSLSPTGPYLDQDGVDMIDREGSLVLESEGRYIGPGHAGILPYRQDGQIKYIFTFHFYDGEHDGKATLGMRELIWQDGWPVVTNVAFSRH
jgi:arabinan endo-1,5-alpha-L-arabinosidase